MTSHRKLAAILSADVAGYSRLMADDERATVETLNAYRQLIRERVTRHEGRVVDAPGDALLAEFPSAVEAVDCAAEIQHELDKRNAQLAAHRRMLFRLGINLGDVLEEGGALYGDGVNVAARLQELAEPGGICISGTAFDQVEGKLSLAFKFIGEQHVKNITKPVRTYQLVTGVESKNPRPSSGRKKPAVIASVVIVLAAAVTTAIIWIVHTPSSKHQSADLTLAMPTGPAIAVLPFTNISGDPNEDYFSDGLTEDIITELARIRELHVLARNTTFQYKGQAVDIPTIAKKLGVQYVLEGGVRKESARVRITAQLIDATNGAHIWAERYDRKLNDIFAVQDEITTRIVSAIAAGSAGLLQESTRRKLATKRPENLEAYELVLRATAPLPYTQSWYEETSALLERAIRLDPNYARARQEYAWLKLMGWIFRFEKTELPPKEIKLNAIKAVELDPNDALAHRTAAYGYFFENRLDLFEQEAQLALGLAPYDADVLAELGMAIAFTGNWELGTKLVNKAYQLNPVSAGGWYHTTLHYDYYRRGNFHSALEAVRRHPGQSLCETQWKYVAAYGQLGEPEKAKEHWNSCVASVPGFSPDRLAEIMRVWNFPGPFIQHYLEGVRRAGYPCQSGCRVNP